MNQEEFFNNYRHRDLTDGTMPVITFEELYQLFKARLAAESALVLFVGEDV